MKLKKNCWYFVKKINKIPYYFNSNGEMDHLMNGNHKIKYLGFTQMYQNTKLYYFYDPISNNDWFLKMEDLETLKPKLINILNR